MSFRLILLTLLILFSLSLRAQSRASSSHYIRGTVHDSAGTVLEEATISCWPVPGDQPIHSLRSGRNGFAFHVSQAGQYRLIASYLGYTPDTIAVSISENDTAALFAKFILRPSSKPLMEVIVKASIPPVIVKSDTIGFNAAAFPTRPFASVEDLLKKLPGGAIRMVGKGMVANGVDLREVFDGVKLLPDCQISGSDGVLFLHRTRGTGNGTTGAENRDTGPEDIYFISNQSAHRIVVDAAFRVKGKAPELWDPLLGTVRELPAYTQAGEVTRVALQLERYGSCFVVFRPGATKGVSADVAGRPASADVAANFPEPKVVVEIRGPWTVRFDPLSRGPVKPVVFDTLTDWARCGDTAIKYYSGKAVYKNTFRLTGDFQRQADKRHGGAGSLFLDLGMVRAMAKVKVNGVYVGGVWTPPYVVDISRAVKKGDNIVEVEVVNTWVNRLIGDSRLPERERKTWMNVNPYTPESRLESSGLLGPVRVVRAR